MLIGRDHLWVAESVLEIVILKSAIVNHIENKGLQCNLIALKVVIIRKPASTTSAYDGLISRYFRQLLSEWHTWGIRCAKSRSFSWILCHMNWHFTKITSIFNELSLSLSDCDHCLVIERFCAFMQSHNNTNISTGYIIIERCFLHDSFHLQYYTCTFIINAPNLHDRLNFDIAGIIFPFHWFVVIW